MKKTKVLVTDGGSKHALAAVRCLGRHGEIETYVTSENRRCLCSHSKYCCGVFVLPGPSDEDQYVHQLMVLLREKDFDVLLPITYNCCEVVAKNKEKFGKFVVVPTVDYRTFKIAGRKDKTLKFATGLGIPVPKTYEIFGLNDLNRLEVESFPVVIKATKECGSVQYASNKQELLERYEKMLKEYSYHNSYPIVQEYIPGDNGFGFYALYNKGRLVVCYMHRRMHMYPRSGGVSTMASTYCDQQLYDLGKRMLDNLKWHGVAMVEFKQHEDNGRFYLMEVNPKYWGSLDLGVAAGFDIPYYHVMIALGREYKIDNRERQVIFRWPDQDFLYAISGENIVLEILKWIALFLNPKVKDNIWLTDMGPTWHLIKKGVEKFV